MQPAPSPNGQGQYDVLIIGARVAGASLALLLSQRGYRVLLVDRDAFPSDTMSTHYLGPFGIDLVRQLGVLDEIEAAGFRRMTRSRTWVSDCLLEGPVAPPGTYALAPRRDVFDTTLIRRAARHGATFLPRTRCHDLIEENGRVVGAIVVPHGGEPMHISARVVVGADGRGSKVADLVGADRYDEVKGLRPVYYGYYDSVEPLPETALELFFGNDQIGFIFPMQPGKDCLALEIQPEDFADFRKHPQEAFEQRFRALPGMAARMRSAQLEGRIFGMRAVENFFRTPYGPGWALIGDAGYLKDPVTGMGMSDAMSQAFMLANALGDIFAGADWNDRMVEFHQKRDATSKPSYDFTLWFARMRDMPQDSLAWLRASMANPVAGRALAHAIPTILPQAYPEIARPMVMFGAEAFGALPVTLPDTPAISVSAATD